MRRLNQQNAAKQMKNGVKPVLEKWRTREEKGRPGGMRGAVLCLRQGSSGRDFLPLFSAPCPNTAEPERGLAVFNNTAEPERGLAVFNRFAHSAGPG